MDELDPCYHCPRAARIVHRFGDITILCQCPNRGLVGIAGCFTCEGPQAVIRVGEGE